MRPERVHGTAHPFGGGVAGGDAEGVRNLGACGAVNDVQREQAEPPHGFRGGHAGAGNAERGGEHLELTPRAPGETKSLAVEAAAGALSGVGGLARMRLLFGEPDAPAR